MTPGQEDLAKLYKKMVHEIETHIPLMTNPTMVMPHMQQLIQAIHIARNMMDKPSATALVQKVCTFSFAYKGFFDGLDVVRILSYD